MNDRSLSGYIELVFTYRRSDCQTSNVRFWSPGGSNCGVENLSVVVDAVGYFVISSCQSTFSYHASADHLSIVTDVHVRLMPGCFLFYQLVAHYSVAMQSLVSAA